MCYAVFVCSPVVACGFQTYCIEGLQTMPQHCHVFESGLFSIMSNVKCKFI